MSKTYTPVNPPVVTGLNLCTNPRAHVDTAGWSIQGTGGEVLTRTASPVAGCPQPEAFQCTLNSNTRIHMADLAVVNGDVVRFTGALCKAVAGTTGTVEFLITNSSFGSGQNFAVTSLATWTVGTVTFTATGTDNLHVYVHGDGNGTVQWSQVLLTKNNSVVTYFDGDSAGAVWNGTPHASTSQKVSTWLARLIVERGVSLDLTVANGVVTVPDQYASAVDEAFVHGGILL